MLFHHKNTWWRCRKEGPNSGKNWNFHAKRALFTRNSIRNRSYFFLWPHDISRAVGEDRECKVIFVFATGPHNLDFWSKSMQKSFILFVFYRKSFDFAYEIHRFEWPHFRDIAAPKSDSRFKGKMTFHSRFFPTAPLMSGGHRKLYERCRIEFRVKRASFAWKFQFFPESGPSFRQRHHM